MEQLISKLKSENYNITINDSKIGIKFDVIATKKIGFVMKAKFNILIKDVGIFGKEEFNEWLLKFKLLSEKAKNYWIGEYFALVLIVDDADLNSELIKSISDVHYLYGLKAGGGKIIITNKQKKVVLADLGQSPWVIQKSYEFVKKTMQEYLDLQSIAS